MLLIILLLKGACLPWNSSCVPWNSLYLPWNGWYLPWNGWYLPLNGLYLPWYGLSLPWNGLYLPWIGLYLPLYGYWLPENDFYLVNTFIYLGTAHLNSLPRTSKGLGFEHGWCLNYLILYSIDMLGKRKIDLEQSLRELEKTRMHCTGFFNEFHSGMHKYLGYVLKTVLNCINILQDCTTYKN